MQLVLTPEILLTVVGIIGIIYGLILTLKTVGVLRPLGLQGRYWILVAFIIFFLMMYVFQLLTFLGYVVLPISLELMVSLVYMGGAIYVVLVSVISLGLWRNVAGTPLTDEEAREMFAKHVGNAPSMEQFRAKDYSIKCNICEENVAFNLVDIVSSHADSIERGIEVQSGMGLKMVVVYPRHVCKDGLRETPVKLDDAYKYRSHGESRPV
ncbi:MAG: hypothetical protein ACXABX_05210 [Candidatus Thorarchaeota archaeon]|jgi:hypothetical protein